MSIRIMLERWVQEVKLSSETKRAYKRAVEFFMIANKMKSDFNTEHITHDHYIKFLVWLNKKYRNSGQTRAQYSVGVLKFFDYLVLRDLSSVNTQKCRIAKKETLGKASYHLKRYNESDVEDILYDVEQPIEHLFSDKKQKLRAYRDRAFLLTLADTGLRVHEACKLTCGDLDRNKGEAIIIGKGDKQAAILFSERSIKAINEYLDERAELDGASGKPPASLPIFAQHSKSSSDKVEPITTKTGRDIVANWLSRVLGDKKKGTITPHTFRHWFVNEIINTTDNVKLAKEMARHEDIGTTDRYAQLNNKQLKQAYREIFNRKR